MGKGLLALYGITNRILKIVRSIQYPSRLPPRILILLTNPRSGSTWLFDALRCHPAIYVHQRTIVYEQLCLSGRRYPRDLSNTRDAVQKTEVRPGLWERIPSFAIPDTVIQRSAQPSCQSYAIEKCHPEFYNFDTHTFNNNVLKLENKGTRFQFVYQIRDPKSSITSFINYQSRNPTWMKEITGIHLIQYMSQTYGALLDAATKRPGLIIDYSDIASNMAAAIDKVYQYIWPDATPQQLHYMQQVSHEAMKATSRENRSITATPFLGSVAGPITGNNDEYSAFFNRYNVEIKQCYRSYNLLLNLA